MSAFTDLVSPSSAGIILLQFRQDGTEIEELGIDRQIAIGGGRPFFLKTIAIDLYANAVVVAKVNRLADSLIGGAIDQPSAVDQPFQGPCHFPAARIEYRKMVQSRSVAGWSRTTDTPPGVQPNMVVIFARRKKRGRISQVPGQLEIRDFGMEFN